MSNLTFLEFMKEIVSGEYKEYSKTDIDSLGKTSFGSDIYTFRDDYERCCDIRGSKIYHLNNKYILRIGFVVETLNHKMWHTVRMEALSNIFGHRGGNYLARYVEALEKEVLDIDREVEDDMGGVDRY